MYEPMTTTEPRTEPMPTQVSDGGADKVAPRGTRVKRKSFLSGLFSRFWIVLVITGVVAVSALCVYRLHGIFGVHRGTFGGGSAADQIIPFNPKVLKLDVWGSPGNVATINYLDVDSHPTQALNVPLPWSVTLTTTQPAIPANLVAQGSGDFIACKITEDNGNGEGPVVKVTNQSEGVNAFTFCLNKSA
jgi:hypothetical protein